MDYTILVNKNNPLMRANIPRNLVSAESKYKEGILLDCIAKENFEKLKKDAAQNGYYIDVESGYRNYDYQEKIYNKLIEEKGFNYAFRHIAAPGESEHQTGLALDFCIYREEKCYIEHEIEDFIETKWVHNNAHRYGFILRYPEGKEDITGYNYEPWHLRYVGSIAPQIKNLGITLEEYHLKKNSK